MQLICLIGRHGTGKSTVGRAASNANIKHVSVGLLRRLANTNNFPADVPASLMNALRRASPGAPLPAAASEKLLRYVATFESCILDGFPSSLDHLALLPKNTIMVAMWSPRALRQSRLEQRAAQSVRQWIAGRPSPREQSLASVMHAARTAGKLRFIANRTETPDQLAAKLMGLVQ